jgi:hypothetical protein
MCANNILLSLPKNETVESFISKLNNKRVNLNKISQHSSCYVLYFDLTSIDIYSEMIDDIKRKFPKSNPSPNGIVSIPEIKYKFISDDPNYF